MKMRGLGIAIVGIMVMAICGTTASAQESYWREESAWGEGVGFPGENWAMYFSYTIDGGGVTTDLIADFDEYLDIGDVTVTQEIMFVEVTLEVFNGWQLNETHVDVAIIEEGDSLPDFPMTKINKHGKGGNPKVGQFVYTNETHYLYPGTTTVTFEVPLSWMPGQTVYIAVHAEVAIAIP